MRMPFVQLHQDAIVKARTMARLLKLPAYAGIGLAGELFVWALDMAPEDDDGNVDWSGDLGKDDPIPLVAAAVGFEGDPEALFAAFIRVGFIQPPDRHLRKNARVRGLDLYEAAHRKAQKDRERKRVHRNSGGSREDGAGQTQTQTQTQDLLPKPPSRSAPPQPVENPPTFSDAPTAAAGHWGKVADQLADWVLKTRDLRGIFRPTPAAAVEKLAAWAYAWCSKYQPDEAELERMHEAFVGFLDDPVMRDVDHDARVVLWISEGVWFERWNAQRAKARELERGAA